MLKQDGKIMYITIVHAYNCIHLNVTVFSPYFLMIERCLMLPINIEFGVWTPDILAPTTELYLQKLQSRLQWAY